MIAVNLDRVSATYFSDTASPPGELRRPGGKYEESPYDHQGTCQGRS